MGPSSRLFKSQVTKEVANMAIVDDLDLLHWRSLPAHQLLSCVPTHAKLDVTFVVIKGKNTERWHANINGCEFELIPDGPKFFDTRAIRGGGGSVDLVMHLYRIDFKAATALLRRLAL